ncbi:MAG: hypothetical protein KGD60_01050 [Candidatus Thorarchaeota archaeon]|nr:hypothetical protein [Candidatus Thorarchaeota archaeon]
MQGYPAAPPNPLFGILSWGFVIIIIYGFVRLSTDGEDRFNGCKKALYFGVLGMVIVTLIESLIFWNWSLQIPVVIANPLLVWGVSMMLGLPFIVIPMIDLAVQWYFLRK